MWRKPAVLLTHSIMPHLFIQRDDRVCPNVQIPPSRLYIFPQRLNKGTFLLGKFSGKCSSLFKYIVNSTTLSTLLMRQLNSIRRQSFPQVIFRFATSWCRTFHQSPWARSFLASARMPRSPPSWNEMYNIMNKVSSKLRAMLKNWSMLKQVGLTVSSKPAGRPSVPEKGHVWGWLLQWKAGWV